MLRVLLSDALSYNPLVAKLEAPGKGRPVPVQIGPSHDQTTPINRTESRIGGNPNTSYADSRVQFFRRLPTFFPQLGFLLLYASLCLLDTLLDTLFAPLKMIVTRFSARESLATFLVACGVVALLVAAPNESRLYSALYHFVRASSLIKLYVVFNMLELADRVLSSFSTDIVETAVDHFDSYLRSPGDKSLKRDQSTLAEVVVVTAVAVVSVVCHTFVLVAHVATLNVAINSEDSSLVGLLISNNFVELKTVIFKKNTAESLFTVVCADAVEWVQNAVFICVMLLQHIQTEGLGSLEFADIAMIVCCEVVIDALKHMFASRFNGISLVVYGCFIEGLMMDVALRRFLGELNLPVVPSKPGYKPTHKFTSQYCSQSELVPNPARRAAFSPFPYASLIIWAAWPILRVLWSLSPTNVVLVSIVAILGKLLLVTTTTGIATRYACRTVMERPRQPPARRASQSPTPQNPLHSSHPTSKNEETSVSQGMGGHAIGVSPPAFCHTPTLAPGWSAPIQPLLQSSNPPTPAAVGAPLQPPPQKDGTAAAWHPFADLSNDPPSLSPFRPSTPQPPPGPSLVAKIDPFVDSLLFVDRFNLNAGKKK